jgi:hypothetical protein
MQTNNLNPGDQVEHPEYGTGEVFEISDTFQSADINLDKEYTDQDGNTRDTVVLPIDKLKKHLNIKKKSEARQDLINKTFHCGGINSGRSSLEIMKKYMEKLRKK